MRAESSVGALGDVVGATIVGDRSVTVSGVTHDSARVLDGTLFCCIVGERFDGHRFAEAAVAAGARALLVQHRLDLDVVQLVVEDTRAAMGPLAAAHWGWPSVMRGRGELPGAGTPEPVQSEPVPSEPVVTVVGVTGTNGKTTIVTLIQQLATELGVDCAVIGTLTGARTTPEATDLQSSLRSFADAGVQLVAMEVSSHALELHRVDGTQFALAIFTNLGVDHLDFHQTSEKYFAAKARLFEPDLSLRALVNTDDVHGRLLRDASRIPVDGYSIERLEEIELGPRATTCKWRGERVDLPLAGRFNLSNALGAAEAMVALGHPVSAVAAALATVSAPPGRFERVEIDRPFSVIVDFAHTPDALSNLLVTARELVDGGRLRVVFGCGGDRDRSKRPQMGAVATELADEVMITSDNPRSEDPATIIAAVESGCSTPVSTEVDRRVAVWATLDRAGRGDVVVIAGKGHETTQIIGNDVAAFDDREVVAEWASTRSGGSAQ